MLEKLGDRTSHFCVTPGNKGTQQLNFIELLKVKRKTPFLSFTMKLQILFLYLVGSLQHFFKQYFCFLVITWKQKSGFLRLIRLISDIYLTSVNDFGNCLKEQKVLKENIMSTGVHSKCSHIWCDFWIVATTEAIVTVV